MSMTVLVVEDDQSMQRAIVRMLTQYESLKIETANDGDEGLRRAREINPDLIVSDYEMPGLNGFELCAQVKSDPELAHAMFVVLSGFSDTQLKISGLNLGVDDYLTKPVEAPEFLAKIKAVLRTKRLHDEIRTDREELQELHRRLSGSFDRLLSAMIHVLGLKVPGAAERGEHLAAHAETIARRMDVPDEYLEELSLAARLHELGKLVQPDHEGAEPSWDYLKTSDAVLSEIEQLHPVASLVIGIGEHWDGSGQPNHLMQGQIPLRSRILRTLIDLFQSCIDDNTPTADALLKLERFAGTRYDPLVVKHVTSEFGDQADADWMPNSRCVPLEDLHEGMILAKDLNTGSGVKLLSRGAEVTAGTLDLIRQRHVNDPIVYGAWVQKAG